MAPSGSSRGTWGRGSRWRLRTGCGIHRRCAAVDAGCRGSRRRKLERNFPIRGRSEPARRFAGTCRPQSRTHEIGIRKSVGARRQDILNQFLVESSMLAGLGGLIGVVLAWMIALILRSFTPIPMAVPISAVLTGLALSSGVGLFFGIYPAQQAAKLDPIEALRTEQ